MTQNRDKEVIRAARKRFIEEVKDWSASNQSVKQLVFRLKTVHVEPPPFSCKKSAIKALAKQPINLGLSPYGCSRERYEARRKELGLPPDKD